MFLPRAGWTVAALEFQRLTPTLENGVFVHIGGRHQPTNFRPGPGVGSGTQLTGKPTYRELRKRFSHTICWESNLWIQVK